MIVEKYELFVLFVEKDVMNCMQETLHNKTQTLPTNP